MGLLVLCFGVLELGVAAFPGYLPGPSFPVLGLNQRCFAWDAELRFRSAFPGYSAVHALFIVQTKLPLFHRWSFLRISERIGPAFLPSLSLCFLSRGCFVPAWFYLNVKETQSGFSRRVCPGGTSWKAPFCGISLIHAHFIGSLALVNTHQEPRAEVFRVCSPLSSPLFS